MNFEIDNIYHIYNQGNNRQKIFYGERNYVFFVEKIRRHILPYADVLAWCLMPNHFHLMVYVHSLDRPSPISSTSSQISSTSSQIPSTASQIPSTSSDDLKSSDEVVVPEAAVGAKPETPKKETIIQSIAIMLRSYTRAINKQENRSGSLFRPHTKAICLTELKGITPSFVDTKTGTMIYRRIAENSYPSVCFNYIHQNPVVAKLVDKPEDWQYSSALHYTGIIDDGITNKKWAHKLGFF